MLRVGLTGGIASGKSTVAAMLRERGCAVLDADSLGHELMRPGEPAYNEVVREFGDAVLAPDAIVDRKKLAAIVFREPQKLAALNRILHPKILEEVQRWFASLDRPGGPEFAFVEAALLVEAGYRPNLDRLVVCWCTPEQQVERLIARGLSPDQARQRLAAQMSVDEKRRAADETIDCSGSLAETERQVDKLLDALRDAASTGRNIS
jgi:dephospho-CoA kinase